MRRLGALLTAVLMTVDCLAVCGAGAPRKAPPPLDAVPETVVLAPPAENWQDIYRQFMESSYDIFAALWPDGLSGMGFIDLDLDGTPELVVFDQGASATLGAQLFDLVDGKVHCVSSTLDSAGGAFSETHLSPVHVCTSFFESFRLSRTSAGWCFWVDSANSTMETAWDEIVRFDCEDGVLTPVNVCYRYLECQPDSGLVVTETYTADGSETDAAGYQAAADVYQEGQDAGYDAKGVFLWNNFDRYDATYDGYMAMVQDALSAYVPITDTVTLASDAW